MKEKKEWVLFNKEGRRENFWVGPKHFPLGPTKNQPFQNREKTGMKTLVVDERQKCLKFFALAYLQLIPTFLQSSHQSSSLHSSLFIAQR